MSLRTAAFLLLVFSSAFVFAQTQAPTPRPQTPRQALIEMITGGHEGAMKHLTLEMQKSLQGDGKNSPIAQLATFDQIKAGSSDFQVFETGQVLLSANDAKNNEKFEVRIDSDDLSGDTDNMDVSFHQFRDGVEQDIPYAAMLSRFTVGMKKQENVWRLNELSINIKVLSAIQSYWKNLAAAWGRECLAVKSPWAQQAIRKHPESCRREKQSR